MKTFEPTDNPLLIAGPCSAETEKQLLETAQALASIPDVKVFRAGVWKPRSRPNSFQGRGAEALPWLKMVQDNFNLPVAVEVAEPEHIEMLYKYGIKIVWFGARTVSNPFSVQKLADALKGSNFSVMVKNPVYPDIELWSGTVERLLDNQLEDIAAIHRGFFPFEKSELRNTPMWEIPIEFRRRFPEIPMICDPSHIAGNKKYISDIAQRAFDLNFAGLMVEVHISPKAALSDSRQQLSPAEFFALIGSLTARNVQSEDADFKNHLEDLREKIDVIDFQLLELLSHRMKYVDEIGEYKKKNNVAVLQLKRWGRILESRLEQSNKAGLSKEFIKQLLELIHKESIARQTEIMKRTNRQ
ncbi:MAG TPA: bifunctional 3-deoxy-7-phosphoheptulonate synthase/chorismate mutase type II [Bacteroidales bacterium]|nr:bifunctional 3-deoxy-7-phosphoheptulonate synthase/chorismate mutase type II [Bacteroidales bacterium]HQP03579.1 bifunctional 3-deoxy-7-phosphoheptulonate synthase/chorismate mutase type II [Bacteroidales bacterium]